MARHKLGFLLIGLAALCAAPAMGQSPAGHPAKKIRIGIVLPEAQLGQGNSGQDVGEPVRQLIVSYMSGPLLELVPLQSRITAQVTAEAQQLNCTHLLYTSIHQKKAGKSMLGKLAPVTGMIPGLGALGGASSAVISGVASQALSVAASQSAQQDAIASLAQAQAGSVKARDEITLRYQFVLLGGSEPLVDESLKSKARQDGEDLLRPLVEQLAEKTVNAALTPAS
jgi:hypothetical protein